MYVDCRYGQLHLTTAYPASGGFDEALPLVFLHADEGSGADFSRCAELLGTDRSIYAPDLPGSGGSDAPRGRLPVAGLALAVVDLIEHLRLKRVDLAGLRPRCARRLRTCDHLPGPGAAGHRRRQPAAGGDARTADAAAFVRCELRGG